MLLTLLFPIDHIFTQPFHGHDRSIANEVEFSGNFFEPCRQHGPEVQALVYVPWPGPNFQGRWSQGQGATTELKLPPAKTWQEGVANHVARTGAVAERLNKTYRGKPVLIVPGGSALAILKTEMDACRGPGMQDFFAEIFADGTPPHARSALCDGRGSGRMRSVKSLSCYQATEVLCPPRL